jgi:phosphoserine phosphatase
MDIKAVIFDIDGTLTEHVSWVCLTEGLGASVDAHDIIYQAYLSEAITYEE